MAKRLDKFTAAFRGSRIPFLLSEVITDGQGEMVDLVCRFANDAAASLLGIPAEELPGTRFTHVLPTARLAEMAPLQAVAFSGSAASLSYTTSAGRSLRLTCYQVLYGVVGCLLDSDVRETESSDRIPGVSAVMELSRDGLRCQAFSRQLCGLTGWSRKELLDRFADDLSALVLPTDWPDLLQDLLDAARESRPVIHPFRLLRREGEPLWVELRAEQLSRQDGCVRFRAAVLDVDRQQRTLARLTDTLRQTETSRDLLADLLDGLPMGCGLFRQTDGALSPLRISRGLADLVGDSPDELVRHLTEDPLWLVPNPERAGLTDAAAQALETGLPFRRVCRLLTKTGQLRASLLGVWRPWQDGSHLLYLTCADVTAEAEQQAELQRRSRLSELLLDRSGNAAMDYDPAADVLRLQRCERDGHRTFRVISGYLAAPDGLEGIHPEDLKKLSSSVKRAVRNKQGETLEFRGDPGGRGWRWYRLTWVWLPEEEHLLGKAEDITLARAADERFHALTARQKKLAPGVLASARLDLDTDRILDAKGVSRHLVRVLFGNTADACLRHLRDNIPDDAQRAAFDRLFRRPALLEAYLQGESRLTLVHAFSPGTGDPVQAETVLELTVDPETAHATAFITIREMSESA